MNDCAPRWKPRTIRPSRRYCSTGNQNKSRQPWTATTCHQACVICQLHMCVLLSGHQLNTNQQITMLNLQTNRRAPYCGSHWGYTSSCLIHEAVIPYSTRNTFCGMEYMPHSQVHNDCTVPIITVILHIFHCACTKWPYFHFRSQIWSHHHVSRPRFPAIHENFSNSAINKGYVMWCWPPTNSFLLLGVLTSVPILVKIDQEMPPLECPQMDTHTERCKLVL